MEKDKTTKLLEWLNENAFTKTEYEDGTARNHTIVTEDNGGSVEINVEVDRTELEEFLKSL